MFSSYTESVIFKVLLKLSKTCSHSNEMIKKNNKRISITVLPLFNVTINFAVDTDKKKSLLSFYLFQSLNERSRYGTFI